MEDLERENRIIKYLEIKPISHGQVDIRRIAIPESAIKEISPAREEELSISLTKQGSNLISLILRRTEAYSEIEEYEIVYGADWYLVAKKLGIKTLWAWVFNLTDEEATAAKAEMERLAGSNTEPVSPIQLNPEDLVTLIGKKLDAIQQETHQRNQEEFEKLQNSFQEKFSQLERKIDDLKKPLTLEDLATPIDEQLKTSRELDKENALKRLNDTQALLSKQSTAIKKEIEKRKKEIQKISLLTATETEVRQALATVGTSTNALNAAWKAIQYWKQPGKLTWSNLEKSLGTRSEHAIKGFGKATYEKLEKIGEINEK